MDNSWVFVTETLPGIDELILFVVDYSNGSGQYVGIGALDENGWYCLNPRSSEHEQIRIVGVTRWAPLQQLSLGEMPIGTVSSQVEPNSIIKDNPHSIVHAADVLAAEAEASFLGVACIDEDKLWKACGLTLNVLRTILRQAERLHGQEVAESILRGV